MEWGLYKEEDNRVEGEEGQAINNPFGDDTKDVLLDVAPF